MSHPAGPIVVAEGSTRLCLRDPANPAYVLKIQVSPRDRTPAGWRERLRRWFGRTVRYFGDNRTELRAWQRLQRRHGDVLAGRFAASHGIVDTRWGPALRCDCVQLGDGSPAPSLYRCIFGEAGHDPAALCAAVDDFEALLIARGIPLFDLNAGNFVVVPAGDGVRLVCVDAKSIVSGKELVPVSRWIPWLRRRKVRRRAERLRQRIRSGIW